MSTGNPGLGEGKGELLLDQVLRVMRVQRYSIHSERTYVDWIRRYAKFHGMRSRADLGGGEAKIEAFLTDLAINQNVAPATQNQAMNALVFLYKKVLEQPLVALLISSPLLEALRRCDGLTAGGFPLAKRWRRTRHAFWTTSGTAPAARAP